MNVCMLLSQGLIHRPCLILKNAEGIYDTLQIYKNKKSVEPLATLKNNVYAQDIIDEAVVSMRRKFQSAAICAY